MNKITMDKIKIENLEIYCKHGVYPEENVLGQKFLVSAILYTSLRPAGLSDDLTKSINYGEICHFIDKFMRNHTFKLIETVAESLSNALLIEYNTIDKIALEVKKPWAPVALPLETVSVCIERGWHTVYIALGSNLGNKEEYLNQAIKELGSTNENKITKVSDFIITKPYGMTEQDDFLNGCLELRTLLAPHELLERLHEIEQNACRERLIHWGPRTLDLDIIFYDDIVYDSIDLTIPHIDMQNRKFVLEPLNQIASYKRHPVLGLTVSQMIKGL